jgi:hypothetical protein
MTKKQRNLVRLWEDFEKAEPDISTERLMEMVCQAGRADAPEVAEALEAQVLAKDKSQLCDDLPGSY